MRTRITELLGIEYPIIQGGMAWVAEYHLAAAVSNAGVWVTASAAGSAAVMAKNTITSVITSAPSRFPRPFEHKI